jgi:hypothetical protein
MPSGSDKRQRTRQCLVRFTEQEFAEVIAKAENAGSPAAAFLRASALGDPGPRAQRRPPVDQKALLQLLGHCGRIGNNVNQIAKHLNTGGRPCIPELREALTAYQDLRTAILAALSMSTSEAAPDDYQGPEPRGS